MKITIDTKEDSPEDIRKIVSMLAKFCDEHAPQCEPANAFANIFGDNAQSVARPEEPSEPAPNMFSIFDDNELKTNARPEDQPDPAPSAFSMFDDNQQQPEQPPTFGKSDEGEVSEEEKKAARLMVEY